MFRVVPFAFSVEKSTPAGKKYTSGAGGAGDKLQLWHSIHLVKQCLQDNLVLISGLQNNNLVFWESLEKKSLNIDTGDDTHSCKKLGAGKDDFVHTPLLSVQTRQLLAMGRLLRLKLDAGNNLLRLKLDVRKKSASSQIGCSQ